MITILGFQILLFAAIHTTFSQQIEYLYEIEYNLGASYYSDTTKDTYWIDWLMKPIELTSQYQLQTETCMNQSQLNMNTIVLLPNHELKKTVTKIPPHYQLIINIGLMSVDVDYQQFYAMIYSDLFSQSSNLQGAVPSQLANICLISSDQNCEFPIYLTQDTINGTDYCGMDKKDVFFTINVQFMHNTPQLEFNVSSNIFDSSQQVVVKSLQILYFPCDQGCSVCTTTSSNCSECISGLFLLETTLVCVSSCPKKFYLETSTNTCRQCSPDCLACTDNITCTQCAKSYFVDGNNACSPCSVNCLDCQNDPSNCISCKPAHYLTATNTCDPCSAECSYCSQTANNCLACSSGYVKQFIDQTNFICQASCNTGYFATIALRVCTLCSSSLCNNCIPDDQSIGGKTGCQLSICQAGLFKFDNECRPDCYKSIYWVAVNDPIQGGVCKPCNPAICSKCITDTICQVCVKGYFLDSNQSCTKCSTNCVDCTGIGQCTTCQNGYLIQAGMCVPSCSAGYFIDGLDCSPCSTGCAQCSGKLYNQCSSCLSTHQLFTSECLIKCDPGYFRDVDRICKQCSNGCKYCTNNVYCNTCFPGFYIDNSTKLCASCNPACLECSGPSALECTSCQQIEILFQQQCITTCPNNYYYDSTTNTCQLCSNSGCQICTQINQCSKCKNLNQYLMDNQSCVDLCPSDHQNWSVNVVSKNGSQYTQLICMLLQCQQGFKQIQDKCVEICGDGLVINHQCDDGNQIDGDGCSSSCQVEKNFDCIYSKTALKSICTFNFNFFLSKGSKNQIIINQNAIITNYKNIYQIKLQSIDQFRYSYEIAQDKNNQSQLIITFDFTIQVDTNLISNVNILLPNNIQFSAYSSAQPYKILKSSDSIQFNSGYIPSSDVQQASIGISQTTQAVSRSIIASFIPMVFQIFHTFYQNNISNFLQSSQINFCIQTFLGSINYVTKVVDISQLIYIHIFIDIHYPYGTQLFLESFQDFQLPFLINPFNFIFPQNYQQNSYPSFTNNGVQATFLLNAGDQITTLLCTFIGHQLLKYVFKKNEKYSRIIQNFFIYGFYAEIIMSIYIEVILAVFLQFTNMSAKSGIDVFNYIVTFVILLTFIPLPFITAYYLKKIFPQRKEQHYEQKLGFFWEDIKEGTFYSMIYNIYLHMRKIFFAFVIVFFNFNPISQCILLSIPSLLLGIFVLVKKPFTQKYENYKQIAQEILLICGAISIASLKRYDDYPEREREMLSLPIIVFFLLILFIHFFSTLYEMYKVIRSYQLVNRLKQLIKKCTHNMRKKKVSASSTLGSPNNQNIQDNQEKQEIENLEQSIISGQIFKTQLRRLSQLQRKQRVSQFGISNQNPLSSADVSIGTQNLDFESKEKMFDKKSNRNLNENNQIKSDESFSQKQSNPKQQQSKESSKNEINSDQLSDGKERNLLSLLAFNNVVPISQVISQEKEPNIFKGKEASVQGSSKIVISLDNQVAFKEKRQLKTGCSIIADLENEDDFNNLNQQNQYNIGSQLIEIIPMSSKFISNSNSPANSPFQLDKDQINEDFTDRYLKESSKNQEQEGDSTTRSKNIQNPNAKTRRKSIASQYDSRKNSRLYVNKYQDSTQKRKSQFFDPSSLPSWR